LIHSPQGWDFDPGSAIASQCATGTEHRLQKTRNSWLTDEMAPLIFADAKAFGHSLLAMAD
jgi:Ni/Fe-hydrogenase subunit HybB-like protein